MSTETDTTNPDTGVGGQSDALNDDDLSTEQFDRMEAPEGDDDDAETGDAGEGDDDKPADKAEADEDPDTEEIELSDGRKVKVPKEVALARLRHDDYTRKTQELSTQREALATERQTWESEREASRAALPEEHAKLAVLNSSIAETKGQLAEFNKVDWEGWSARVARGDPNDPEVQQDRLTFRQYADAFEAARLRLATLEGQHGEASTDLKTKEDARLQSQREAQAASLAKAQEETGKVLAQRIEGWGPEKARDVVLFAHQALGVEPKEMAEATDPRIWLVLHRAMNAEADNTKLREALKKHQTANANSKAQASQPAERAKGSGAKPRDPAKPEGDGLSDEEWYARRNRQVSARRSA